MPATLSFVGFGEDKVVCEGLDLQTVKYGDLNESLKQLIRTDINADGPSSALSQSEDFIDRLTETQGDATKDGEDESEEIFTSVADEEIQVLQSRIGLWADERNAWDRQHRIITSGEPVNEFLFAQECTLPSSNVWETRGEKSWPESTYSSFLPPQINLLSFTSDENTDEDGNYLDKLASYYEVNRVEQQRLTESYPSVVPSLYGWGALAESNNFSLGESYVDYSVPPSYLFEKRNAPLEHDMAGIGLGASIGITISCLIAFITGMSRAR
ncbi:hypothetical protein [Glutamicibacter arilaitensis]|uniref:hypothetical protein n=1 Tax=Glutamicibacter arilaitensis TaxID=256701 RepID=UPI00384C7101